MKKKYKIYLIFSIFIAFCFLIISISLILTNRRFDQRSDAVALSDAELFDPIGNLVVTISPEIVSQVDTYTVTATINGKPYAGGLEVDFVLCELNKPRQDSGCTPMKTRWDSDPLRFDSNGKAIANLGEYIRQEKYSYLRIGSYYHTWKRINKDGEVIGNPSNQTTLHVHPVNVRDYWDIEDSAQAIYKGINYKSGNKEGKVQIDYHKELTSVCGNDTWNMRFTKSNKYMYWNPCYGDNCTDDYNRNLAFALQWKSGNGMEALSAPYWTSYSIDNSKYQSQIQELSAATAPISSVNGFYDTNFLRSMVYMNDLKDPSNMFPYLQAPAYLDFETYNKTAPIYTNKLSFAGLQNIYQDFCTETAEATKKPNNPSAIYVSNYSYDTITTPAYSGDVIVFQLKEVYNYNPSSTCKTYEDIQNKKCGYVLREDWYFAKGIGLVKLDQKYFGRNGNKECYNDDDCLSKHNMKNPDFSMSLISKSQNQGLLSQKPNNLISITKPSSGKISVTLNYPKTHLSQKPEQMQMIITDGSPSFNASNYGIRILKPISNSFYLFPDNTDKFSIFVPQENHSGTKDGWKLINMNEKIYDPFMKTWITITGYSETETTYTISADIEVDSSSILRNKKLTVYLYAEGKEKGKNILLLSPVNKYSCPSCYNYYFDKVYEIKK
ncbi:MAG: hypothetical protein ACOCXT_05720 [Candidatus Dojkabacteria bacterium]